MNKKGHALAIAFCIAISASAQTLFTYGDYSADAKDFLRAFNKNNAAPVADKSKAMKDYLDLYIASRLKIREAYNRGYDTITQIKNDIEGLRSQIIDNYLNDPKEIDRLTKEAFTRSLKDVHVEHIFISFRTSDGTIDMHAAEEKAKEVASKLSKGEAFEKLALDYSNDPTVKDNRGDIGFITVFSLPYEFENVVYITAPGKVSAPVRSKIGYHFFKNLGERPAVGKIRAAQILLAYPPGIDATGKIKLRMLADSLYQRLMKGDNIGTLATAFSNDYVSAAAGGTMPDMGVGQYDAAFEKTVFALAKDGDISKPFMTSHGYHIVKRLKRFPVITDPNNKSNLEDLKIKVSQSDRMQFARNMLMNRVIRQIQKTPPYSEKELWALSDSLLDYKPIPIPVTIQPTTVIFSLGNKQFNVNDFVMYSRAWRYKPDGSGMKSYQQLLDEYIHHEAENYYREHLEDFNEDFRYQMNEFKDGNLFFEIMQREVWSKAQNDSAALVAYYEKNKSRYNWKQSADAIIFFCNDETASKILYDNVKKNPAGWKNEAEALAEKVVADSGRYEFEQIPNAAKIVPHAGLLTTPVKNKTDNSVSFAYVLKTYPANTQRSFAEAKGIVISDYQAELEKKWIAELKQKYPVKIDEKVWQQINK